MLEGQGLKILHIITGLEQGGAEQALFNLLQGGLAESFECYVVSLKDKGIIGPRIEALGVPVDCLGMWRGIPSPPVLGRLRAAVKKIQPDIVQGWMYHGNIAATLARRFAPKKTALIWSIRHSLYDIAFEKRLTQLVVRANRFFSKSPHKILYNSYVSRQQHENFGFCNKRGLVIPNGIDTNKFRFSNSAREKLRERLNIPAGSIVVGHTARFHPMKDHPLFLQAGVEIARRYKNVHFLMLGREVTWENELFTRLIPESLQNRFHLVGERKDVADTMCAMDIFASSSYGEGFPNVLGEAMAVGLPCVATDVGDCGLIIGDTGVLVKSRDLQGFINGLTKLLKMPDERRKLLGQKARKRIVENYSLSEMVERYEKVYGEVLGFKCY